ncbi:MAG: sugar phosphate nucleotidyltransferase, partial [Bacteroidales bacterium]
MQAVILAAGESSRFWPLNTKHKSLIKIMGKPLIWYTIDGLKKAGIKEVIIVQGPEKDIESELSNCQLDIDIKYVVQSESKGMGDGLLFTEDLIKKEFFVLNPYHFEDVLKYGIEKMTEKFEAKGGVILLGKNTDNPWNYGVLKLNEDT